MSRGAFIHFNNIEINILGFPREKKNAKKKTPILRVTFIFKLTC